MTLLFYDFNGSKTSLSSRSNPNQTKQLKEVIINQTIPENEEKAPSKRKKYNGLDLQTEKLHRPQQYKTVTNKSNNNQTINFNEFKPPDSQEAFKRKVNRKPIAPTNSNKRKVESPCFGANPRAKYQNLRQPKNYSNNKNNIIIDFATGNSDIQNLN